MAGSDDSLTRLPEETVRFVIDYDIPRIADMFASLGHLPVMQQREIVRKNLESFRRFPKQEEGEEEDDEVDELGDGEDEDVEVDEVEEDKGEGEEKALKMMVDDNKLATQGERQCKKPRLGVPDDDAHGGKVSKEQP